MIINKSIKHFGIVSRYVNTDPAGLFQVRKTIGYLLPVFAAVCGFKNPIPWSRLRIAP